jgi:hypothetical protein
MKREPNVHIYMGWPSDYIKNGVNNILDPFWGSSLLVHFFMFEEGFELEISKPSI